MNRKKWRNKSVAELGAMLREAELRGSEQKAAKLRRELNLRERERLEVTRPAPKVRARKRPTAVRPGRASRGGAVPKRARAPLHKLTDDQLRQRFAHPGLLDRREVQAEMSRRKIGPKPEKKQGDE